MPESQTALMIPSPAAGMTCRLCANATFTSVIDLGWSPLANGYRDAASLSAPCTYYPLHAVLCDACQLMQLTGSPPPEDHFTGYRYFSSYSSTMVEHAKRFAEETIPRFGLNPKSQVVELASNDGYLLQHFKAAGIPTLGIEPASNVAEIARKTHGIRTIDRYFGLALALELSAKGKADLVVANNVLAHVPDPNDFVAGIAALLAPEGVVSVEFPDVANLLESGQFDTIYHEHISYFSFSAARQLFGRHHLRIFDAQNIPVHGGSLRLYACHAKAKHQQESFPTAIKPIPVSAFKTLASKAQKIRLDLLSFLLKAHKNGQKVAGYGAAAKGNTLLNYCGIRDDLLKFVADASPHKQGLYLPGAGLSISSPERIRQEKPDYVLILPWNIRNEIMAQLSYISEWGGKFVTAIPSLEILSISEK